MARPTKPKEGSPDDAAPAPAADGGGGGNSKVDIKLIITILAISVVSLVGSAASAYFLAPMAMGPLIAEQVTAAMAASQSHEGDAHGGEHAEEAHHDTAMNLELDEFTVNLKTDPSMGGNQFLRTKMTLMVTVPEEEFCDPTGGAHHASVPASLQEGHIVGAAAPINSVDTEERLIASGGGGPDPFVVCQQAFTKNMARYVPSLRDIINQALMKRTAGTLASIEGQELLKDEIMTEANHLLGEKYSLSRVNFSDFIIQY